MTTRSLRNTITNALDFLVESELALYANVVSMCRGRVGWYDYGNAPFLSDYGHATSRQYLDWVSGGHYSALLRDAGLLQLAYSIDEGDVIGHRLAYIPCPVIVDEHLLEEGEPVGDVVKAQLEEQDASAAVLRSPMRFDYDPGSAGSGHPASHMTINGPDCRIACVAPVHPYRFIDFVFRHFYPELRVSQREWFGVAARSNIGASVITEADTQSPHLVWNMYAG